MVLFAKRLCVPIVISPCLKGQKWEFKSHTQTNISHKNVEVPKVIGIKTDQFFRQ